MNEDKKSIAVQVLFIDRSENNAEEKVSTLRNAGIAIHHLGVESLTLATAGGSPLAQIRAEMETLGVPLEVVETQMATRVCTTVLDRSTGTMTELVENGRPVSEAELHTFEDRFVEAARKADAVILIGTLPQGTPQSYYRRLLKHVSCLLRNVVDVEFVVLAEI